MDLMIPLISSILVADTNEQGQAKNMTKTQPKYERQECGRLGYMKDKHQRQDQDKDQDQDQDEGKEERRIDRQRQPNLAFVLWGGWADGARGRKLFLSIETRKHCQPTDKKRKKRTDQAEKKTNGDRKKDLATGVYKEEIRT